MPKTAESNAEVKATPTEASVNAELEATLAPHQLKFRKARRVSTPLIAITTVDPATTTMMLVEATKKVRINNTEERKLVLTSKGEPIIDEQPIIAWRSVGGVTPVNEPGLQALKIMLGMQAAQEAEVIKKAAMITTPGELVNKVLSAPPLTIIIMYQAHRFLAENDANMKFVAQGIWNLRDQFKEDGRQFVMLAPALKLPIELAQDVMTIDQPLPSSKDLERIGHNALCVTAGIDENEYHNVLKPSIIAATMGLSEFAAEQAMMMSLARNAQDKRYIDVSECQDRKRGVIDGTPGLKLFTDKISIDDMAGNANLLAFLRRAMSANEYKSVVLIDEIEKAFSGSMTDSSGVGGEMLGQMLSWMEDMEVTGLILLGPPGSGKSMGAKIAGSIKGIPTIQLNLAQMKNSLVGESTARLTTALKTVDAVSGGKGGVLAIATSNGLDSLPPELLARFRMGVFFVDLPNEEERAAMWKLYKAKYKLPADMPTPSDNGWAGRDIQKCAYNAKTLNMTIMEASEYVVSVSQTSGDKITRLRENAAGRYISANYPGVYQLNDNLTTKEAKTLFERTDMNRKKRAIDVM